jgi:hypothetical protein
MSIMKVKIDTCNYRDAFLATRNIFSHLIYMTMQDQNRNKSSVKTLDDVSAMYLPNQHDGRKETPAISTK